MSFVQPLVLAVAFSRANLRWPSRPILRGVTGVQIEYKEPVNPAHRPIYERLKKRQVLEQYQEFMSPLKLKRSLTCHCRNAA